MRIDCNPARSAPGTSTNGGPKGQEFARSADWKLYPDGKLYNVYQDVLEKTPVSPGELDAKTRIIYSQLQKQLDKMKGTRTIFDLSQYQKPGANQAKAKQSPEAVVCEGKYAGHLQGVCRGTNGNFFWSFTRALVKTDIKGKVMKKVEVPDQHGEIGRASCRERV